MESKRFFFVADMIVSGAVWSHHCQERTLCRAHVRMITWFAGPGKGRKGGSKNPPGPIPSKMATAIPYKKKSPEPTLIL